MSFVTSMRVRVSSLLSTSGPTFPLPWPYRLFFLYVEPFLTLLGGLLAFFSPLTYLSLTHAASAPSASTFSRFASTFAAADPVPVGTRVAVRQLGNAYVLLALAEALVLRAAGAEKRVWRALLLVMLAADAGHLATVAALDGEGGGLWSVRAWNRMGWGNVAFVYFAAAVRAAFLLGVGVREEEAPAYRRSKSGRRD